MIILFASQKGGCGKSTLATNVAAVLAAQKKDILLVDADRQGSASQWSENRASLGSNDAYIPYVARYDEIHLALAEYNEVYDIVIVDVAGRDSTEMRSAMLVADIMIVPTKASQFDLYTLGHISKIMVKGQQNNPKLDVKVVITMAQTATRADNEGAKEFVRSLEYLTLCETTIGERKIFKESNLTGLAVTEIGAKSPSDKLGQSELLELIKELNL